MDLLHGYGKAWSPCHCTSALVEGDGTDQHRITASWLYNRPLGEDANFTTALVWGQNNLTTEGKTNSYLFEADYQRGRDTFFTRVENIQKSGHELVLPEDQIASAEITLDLQPDGSGLVLLNGQAVAHVLNAADLDAAQIGLRAA